MKSRVRDENAAAGKKIIKKNKAEMRKHWNCLEKTKKRNKDMGKKRLSACQGLHNFIKCINETERKGKEQRSSSWLGWGCSTQVISSLIPSMSWSPSLPPSATHSSSALGQFLLVTQWQSQGFNIHVPPWAKNTWIPPHTNHHSWAEMGTHGQKKTIFPDGNFSVVDDKTLLCCFFFLLFFFSFPV